MEFHEIDAIGPIKVERLEGTTTPTPYSSSYIGRIIYMLGDNKIYYGGETAWRPFGEIATTTNRGIVELATDVETLIGTDEERAVTPFGLAYVLHAYITGYDMVSSVGAGSGTISTTPALVTTGPALTAASIYGSSREYIIIPATNYSISSVVVDGVSVGAPSTYTFTDIRTDHTIVANFIYTPPTGITITSSISGAGIGHGAITPLGTIPVTYMGSQAFTVTPSAGWHILAVYVDTASVTVTGSPFVYTFTSIITNHTICATFAQDNWTITHSVSAGSGTISPTSPVLVTPGASASLTFTPAYNYYFSTLSVNGTPSAVTSPYVIPSVTQNYTVVGAFSLNPTLTSTYSDASITYSYTTPAGGAYFYGYGTTARVYVYLMPSTDIAITIDSSPSSLGSFVYAGQSINWSIYYYDFTMTTNHTINVVFTPAVGGGGGIGGR